MSVSEPPRPNRLRVSKYIPEKLYGFAVDGEGSEVFFHLGSFQPGGPWMLHARCKSCAQKGCAWADTPPAPILGELVAVTLDTNAAPKGQSPRASRVERLSAPIPVDGVVESFDNQRGFGFAKGSDGISYHLHRSEMLDRRLPLVGQRVMFYVGVRRQRPRACHIKVCP